MKTISVGFIGAGFSAHLHVHGLKKVHGVNVRFGGVTATRADRAAEFAGPMVSRTPMRTGWSCWPITRSMS